MFPLIVAFIFLLAGLVLLWQTGRRQKASGLPSGRIIYSDTRGWGRVEAPLYDGELGLTGRPDYLVRKGEQVIPVEVKSRRVGEAPPDSHIFQLAAYCLLVERAYGKRPPYGILHYPNRTYAIDFTPALEKELLGLVETMQEQDRQRELDRSHEQPARCRGCGYRSRCDQALISSANPAARPGN